MTTTTALLLGAAIGASASVLAQVVAFFGERWRDQAMHNRQLRSGRRDRLLSGYADVDRVALDFIRLGKIVQDLVEEEQGHASRWRVVRAIHRARNVERAQRFKADIDRLVVPLEEDLSAFKHTLSLIRLDSRLGEVDILEDMATSMERYSKGAIKLVIAGKPDPSGATEMREELTQLRDKYDQLLDLMQTHLTKLEG